jgi:hypothetical protein
MNMTIDISPEERAAYKAQASAEGLSVEEWLKKLANERARPQTPPGIEGREFLAVCAKVKGLTDDLDFSRNRSTARPLDL